MVVDVQGVAATYGQDVRRVRTQALLNLREGMQAYLEEHPDGREQLLAELKVWRTKFAEEGDEAMEDLVLDAMDIFEGWVRPEMQI
jgi:hypothetical protein